MASELSVRASWKEALHFSVTPGSGLTVEMDSMEGGGPLAGPTPMEMVLMSLAGCSGMDVISILRKKRMQVQELEVIGHGQRSEGYPKVYTAIQLEYIVRGKDIDPKGVERAIQLSRDSYCPVWAMLRHSVAITYTYTIEDR